MVPNHKKADNDVDKVGPNFYDYSSLRISFNFYFIFLYKIPFYHPLNENGGLEWQIYYTEDTVVPFQIVKFLKHPIRGQIGVFCDLNLHLFKSYRK